MEECPMLHHRPYDLTFPKPDLLVVAILQARLMLRGVTVTLIASFLEGAV